MKAGFALFAQADPAFRLIIVLSLSGLLVRFATLLLRLRPRHRIIEGLSQALSFCALCTGGYLLMDRWQETGRMMLASPYEFSLALFCLFSLIAIFAERRHGSALLGHMAQASGFLLLIYSILHLDTEPPLLSPPLAGGWLVLRSWAMVMTASCLGLASLLAIVRLSITDPAGTFETDSMRWLRWTMLFAILTLCSGIFSSHPISVGFLPWGSGDAPAIVALMACGATLHLRCVKGLQGWTFAMAISISLILVLITCLFVV